LLELFVPFNQSLLTLVEPALQELQALDQQPFALAGRRRGQALGDGRFGGCAGIEPRRYGRWL
jgi:hypothetical protein